MNLRLWAAIFLGGVFAMPAQVEESRVYFSLTSEESVLPGGEARVRVRAEGVGQLEFRLYKVKDPRAFFLKLDSPSSFGARSGRVFRGRAPLERFADWKRRQYAKVRDLARMQFTPENRRRIRAWMQRKKERRGTPAGEAPAYAGVPVLNPDQLVKRWTQPVRSRRPWEEVAISVPLAEAGVYVLEATDQSKQAYTVLLAAPVAVISKEYEGRLALRVVDRKSGEPRRGCRLEVLDLEEKRSLAKGTSDQEGGAAFEFRDAPGDSTLLLAECGGMTSAAPLHAYAISPQWLGMTGAVHTDRPVYRPGQRVRFRAILRESRGGSLSLPEAGRARVKVDDARGNPVFQKTLFLTKYGTVRGEFDLPEDSALGYFGVEVAPEGSSESVYGGFHVEEYRKPDYEVRVKPSSGRALQGTRMEARIEARYYYGEPVRGGDVEYVVQRHRWYPPWWDWEEPGLDEAEEAYGGEQVLEEKGRLDTDGNLTVSFPLERGAHDYLYRIEARVRDEGGRAISGAASFLGTRAPFLITAQPDRWVYGEGETVRWRVSAADFERKPVAGVAFEVELRAAVKGRAAGRAALTRSGKTGSDGEGVVEFPAPGSGSWVVLTSAATAHGPLREEGWLWVSGGWSGEAAAERVRVALDKTSYKPGETAKALVATGLPRADVWLTVEGASLHWSKFMRIEGGAATVDIPVKSEYAPNVFVTAVFLHGDRFYQGSKILKVPPAEKQIFVELTPSKKEFQPGEPAVFRVTAKDHENRPLRAEFSLGVVDEAIYSIRRDPQPDMVRLFYGHQWNRVETSSSQSFYFWGEAGTRRIELARRAAGRFRAQLKREEIAEPRVRKDFPDTAFWVADLETDAQGGAEARFAFPDSLTTWRATAHGVTRGAQVGSAVARVLVRKDVVVSIAAPRFLAAGDEVVTPVLARNYTKKALRARIAMKVEGLRILEGQEAEIELPPQGEGRVDYRLKAEREGRATLTASAAAAGGADAMEITLPVRAYGLPMSAAAQARLEGTAAQTLVHEFPAPASPAGRTAEVRLTPSLAGAVFGALEYLLEYPYGCTEQVLSGLVPNLAVAEALRTLKLKTPVNRKELDRNVNAGLEKLYAHQNDDGGWGWWRGDESMLFLTSYALLGLEHARENGYGVDEDRRGRAEAWLRGLPERRLKPAADDLAYALLALTRNGTLDASMLDAAWKRRGEMSGFGLASLGLALQKANDGRRGEVAEQLVSMAKQEGEASFWQSRHDLMFGQEAEHSFEATAMAVRFLAGEIPDSPLLDRAVRWLLNHRDGGYFWASTKRTAFVIYGLAPLLRRSGELSPDLTARVLVDGREVLRRRFTAEDAAAAKPVKVTAPATGSRSEVRVETEGRGRLYASVNWLWRQAEAGAGHMPASGFLRAERRYYRLRRAAARGGIVYDLEPWSGPARRGDIVAVRVSVQGAGSSKAFVVEDPLPAGAEAVSRDAGFPLRGAPHWWLWWPGRRELRDERATWFPWRIGDRGYETVYLFRFTNAGKFRAAPARVEAMYEPGVMAWSEAAEWEVLP